MDYNSATNQHRPLHSSASSNTLSRISTVSDITDLDIYGEEYQEYHSPPLRPRESLVSLQSNDGGRERSNSGSGGAGHVYSGDSGWSLPFSGYTGSGGYEPVSVTGGSPPSKKKSRGFSHGTSLRRAPDTIPEEDSIDLVLLGSAAPMGESQPYATYPREEPPGGGGEPAFDLTTSLGPATLQDEAFVKRLQAQEANGKLTGGIGLGIKTETTMSESELLAAGPMPERDLSRSFSRRRPNLGRSATLRQLGQSEANKRGEVIEVIMENESEVDLSLVTGPDALASNPGPMRRSTFPTNSTQSTQVFYPQPNWKPFSMGWPYLLFLIVLSLVLGGAMEVIYQMSTRQPLLTFHTPSDIPPGQYFAVKFAPTIITVTFGLLWQVTDVEVKRLEAFYQLSKEGGALAAESINVDYVTSFNFMRPFRAIQCKHYAVAISSIASLLAVSLVPPLGTACIVLYPDRNQRLADPLGEKYIDIQPVLSRLLTVTFIIIAFLGSILFYQLESRRSGLLGDVKGIAGLASMAVVSHILMDFKDMDVATHKDIHYKLKDHRYVLRNSALAPDDEHPPSKQERDRYTKNHLSENPHPLMLRAVGCIPFIVGITLFLALIPVFLFTPATVLTDKAPWVVTALAVCIKLSWGSLETDVRMMEPFYILSRRHAPPKTLTLDYTAIPFGWVAVRALLNGHLLVFCVGFGTVMTEILTVLVTSLAAVEGRDFIALIPPPGGGQPQNGGGGDDNGSINAGQETVVSFWATLGLAVTILLYMGVVATAVFFRRHHPFLPRQPNTIASVLAFIHQSRMLYDFVGTAKLTNAQMVRRLEGVGKTYGLGWFQGRDGQTHCGVDEEELMSNYKHGLDYSRSNKPWLDRQVEWL